MRRRGFPLRRFVEIPLDGFSPSQLDNLFKMVKAKSAFLKAALLGKKIRKGSNAVTPGINTWVAVDMLTAVN